MPKVISFGHQVDRPRLRIEGARRCGVSVSGIAPSPAPRGKYPLVELMTYLGRVLDTIYP